MFPDIIPDISSKSSVYVNISTDKAKIIKKTAVFVIFNFLSPYK